jgi:gluconate 2-dehydrogenase gamma chain
VSDDDQERPEPGTGISRRDFLRGAALTAAGVMASGTLLPALAGAASVPATTTLSASEFRSLEALVDRIIPADDLGPGAVAAGVPYYIDSSLAGEYSGALGVYKASLTAIDQYAVKKYGGHFADLSAATRDEIVAAVEANTIPGLVSFVGTDTPLMKFALVPEYQGLFFQGLLQHTKEGMFGDPLYGGNKDFIGWNLIGFPGLNPAPSANDQQIGTVVPFAHRSNKSFGGRPLPWVIPETPIKS